MRFHPFGQTAIPLGEVALRGNRKSGRVRRCCPIANRVVKVCCDACDYEYGQVNLTKDSFKLFLRASTVEVDSLLYFRRSTRYANTPL